jgi:murein DD-endopeptidase MepM/ murein hydrolase activator NlpD
MSFQLGRKKRPGVLLRTIIAIMVVLVVVGGYFAYRWIRRSSGRSAKVIAWIRNPEDHPEWAIEARTRCGEAPFQVPTSGYIGYLWDDSFRPGHRHQGIDIFGSSEPGGTPIYAAHAGYLTRLSDWKSTLIIRIPRDPLQPSRQIWTYYTHMASSVGESYIVSDFPPGTSEKFVEAGTLLGYQGNYSGVPNNPTGIHLHFSIVLDDGEGNYLNELNIKNTLDPSPYFGLPLNANTNKGEIPLCPQQ